jgi:hypothetical protein
MSATACLANTRKLYKEAAENPQSVLYCTTRPFWQLPALDIQRILFRPSIPIIQPGRGLRGSLFLRSRCQPNFFKMGTL